MSKWKRHSAEEIIKKLEDADRRLTAGQSVAQVCQALEVSEAFFAAIRESGGIPPHSKSASRWEGLAYTVTRPEVHSDSSRG